jgi:integrative and conjugative element protein (TIGR02256 family)
MLVALKTFTTHYDGDEVRLLAGRSHVVEDHEIAKRHPECFKPEPGRVRGGRDRISSAGTASIVTAAPPRPSRVRGREPWRLLSGSPECAIAYRQSRTRVRLAASARADLVAIAERTSGQDGAESGGLLFGSVSEDLSLVEIVTVGGPGPKAIRESHRFQPDGKHDMALADRVRAESAGSIRELGLWHTHPTIAAPSELDVSHFAGMRGIIGNLYTALIAVPVADGAWRLEAFVVRSGFAQDVCESAFVT